MTAAEVQAQQPGSTTAARPRRVLMGVPSPRATGGGPALHLPMLVADLRDAGAEVVTFSYGRWAEANRCCARFGTSFAIYCTIRLCFDACAPTWCT